MEVCCCWVCCWRLTHNYILASKTTSRCTPENVHSSPLPKTQISGENIIQRCSAGMAMAITTNLSTISTKGTEVTVTEAEIHLITQNSLANYITSHVHCITSQLLENPSYSKWHHIWVPLLEMDGLTLTIQAREVIPQMFYHFSYKPWENMRMPLLRKHWSL